MFLKITEAEYNETPEPLYNNGILKLCKVLLSFKLCSSKLYFFYVTFVFI